VPGGAVLDPVWRALGDGGGATIATQPGAFTWQFDGVGNIILVRAYLPAHELLTWRKSRSVLRGDEPWFEWRTPSRLGAMLGRPTEVPKFRSARWLSSLQPPSHIRSSRSRCGHLLPTLLRLARLVDWGSALALGHRAVLESLVERLWARGRREDVERIRDLLRRGSSASKRDDAGDHLAKLQPPAAKPKRKPTIKPASAQAGLGA
jgi:hypothetical protein